MTVQEYLEKRDMRTYGKRVRVIDLLRGAGTGDWTEYADREVLKINVTTKFIFIYVK